MAGQFLTLSRTFGMEERQALIESVTEDQVMLLANERFDSDRLAVARFGTRVQQSQLLTDFMLLIGGPRSIC